MNFFENFFQTLHYEAVLHAEQRGDIENTEKFKHKGKMSTSLLKVIKKVINWKILKFLQETDLFPLYA